MISFPLTPERGARLLVAAMRSLGDVAGHEFHGNQWVDSTPEEIAAVLAKEPLVNPERPAGGLPNDRAVKHALDEAALGVNFSGRGKVVVQDLSKLKATEKDTKHNVYFVERYRKGWPVQPPVVDQHGNILDRHHRVASAITAGRTSIFTVVVKVPKMKGAAAKHVSPIHAAALAHEPKLSVAFRHAFAMGRKALNVSALRSLGDVAGHEFHGNQWTSGAGVTDGDVADASIAWADKQYPRADLTEKKATGTQPREKFYKGNVDGLRVSTDIPNTDSIGAGFMDSNEYDELPGIREVAIADLDLGEFSAADDNSRVRDLADRIKASGEIKSLIVVIDGTRKPYVLEGGHRAPALQMLGKKTLPAVVIVDHTAQKLRSAGDVAGHEFHGNQWTTGGGVRDVEGAKKRLAELPDVNIRGYDGVSTRAVFGTHVDSAFFVRGNNPVHTVETIDPQGLIPTQDTADRDSVSKFIEKDIDVKPTDEHLPKVAVFEDGRRFILDGHHRLVADVLLARQSRVRVIRVVNGKAVQAADTSLRTAKRTTPKLHVTDGSHRLIAAIISGQKTLRANIIHISSARSASAAFSAEPAVKAIAAALRKTLKPTLLKTLTAGGEAGLALLETRMRAAGDVEHDVRDGVDRVCEFGVRGCAEVHALRTSGDVEGHEFHGNQWTSGSGSAKEVVVTDKLLEVAQKDSDKSSIIMSRIEADAQGVVVGSPRQLDDAINRGDFTIDDVKEHFSATRAALKKEYGDDLILHRYDAPVDKHSAKTLTVYMGDKKLADRFGESKAYHVKTDDVVAVYARQSGYYEFIVSKPKEGLSLYEPKVRGLQQGDDDGYVGHSVARPVSMRMLKRTTPTSIDMQFDAKNQHVIDWADRHAAELIDNITETSREAINNAVAAHAEDGDWNEFYDEVLNAVGDEARADRIARHESMLAASEGQRQGWDQAVESGLLTGDEERVWITTPDEKLCPICEGLADTKSPLGGSYEFDGEEYDGPPAHVQCRCTEGIA